MSFCSFAVRVETSSLNSSSSYSNVSISDCLSFNWLSWLFSSAESWPSCSWSSSSSGFVASSCVAVYSYFLTWFSLSSWTSSCCAYRACWSWSFSFSSSSIIFDFSASAPLLGSLARSCRSAIIFCSLEHMRSNSFFNSACSKFITSIFWPFVYNSCWFWMISVLSS